MPFLDEIRGEFGFLLFTFMEDKIKSEWYLLN